MPAVFVAPPRTISDITAILDTQEPYHFQIELWKAAADGGELKPPTNGPKRDFALYYQRRGASGDWATE